MSVRTSWFVLLFESFLSLLIFYMKVLSIIEGEANILILLNDNNCEFDVAGL